jgi:hypothetical protein
VQSPFLIQLKFQCLILEGEIIRFNFIFLFSWHLFPKVEHMTEIKIKENLLLISEGLFSPCFSLFLFICTRLSIHSITSSFFSALSLSLSLSFFFLLFQIEKCVTEQYFKSLKNMFKKLRKTKN